MYEQEKKQYMHAEDLQHLVMSAHWFIDGILPYIVENKSFHVELDYNATTGRVEIGTFIPTCERCREIIAHRRIG